MVFSTSESPEDSAKLSADSNPGDKEKDAGFLRSLASFPSSVAVFSILGSYWSSPTKKDRSIKEIKLLWHQSPVTAPKFCWVSNPTELICSININKLCIMVRRVESIGINKVYFFYEISKTNKKEVLKLKLK